MNKDTIANLRLSYTQETLDLDAVAPAPIAQFEKWFSEALYADLLEPNAMILATATANGAPSARVVLLKEFDNQGFVFYTNYDSHKGRQLTDNAHCALVFAWLPLERQVRIEGVAERVLRSKSEAYFQSRPKGSQIGATASPQSAVVADRAVLEQRAAEIAAQYADADTLPLPENWGGYCVKPTCIEFWQGRQNRLHDRICYTLQADGSWIITRLAP